MIKRDPKEVEKLARDREAANWRFRAFLKQAEIPSSRIDTAVHALAQEIAKEIDCTSCAACCKEVSPHFGPTDIKRLASHMGLQPSEFIAMYLRKDSEEGLLLKSTPCPFLKDNKCSVYECRPRDCRSFPHLHKRDFVFRLSQAVSNCSLCPIVFNVYEELKREFWHSRHRDQEAEQKFRTYSVPAAGTSTFKHVVGAKK